MVYIRPEQMALMAAYLAGTSFASPLAQQPSSGAVGASASTSSCSTDSNGAPVSTGAPSTSASLPLSDSSVQPTSESSSSHPTGSSVLSNTAIMTASTSSGRPSDSGRPTDTSRPTGSQSGSASQTQSDSSSHSETGRPSATGSHAPDCTGAAPKETDILSAASKYLSTYTVGPSQTVLGFPVDQLTKVASEFAHPSKAPSGILTSGAALTHPSTAGAVSSSATSKPTEGSSGYSTLPMTTIVTNGHTYIGAATGLPFRGDGGSASGSESSRPFTTHEPVPVPNTSDVPLASSTAAGASGVPSSAPSAAPSSVTGVPFSATAGFGIPNLGAPETSSAPPSAAPPAASSAAPSAASSAAPSGYGA